MKAAVYLTDEEVPPPDGRLQLVEDDNLIVGTKEFEREFGAATTLEHDLLTLAAAVLAVDVLVKRGEREEIIRDIELEVPVINYPALNAVCGDLVAILHILSHDNWNISFRRAAGPQENLSTWPENGGTALLFSGGLDSFAAAVDLLDESGPDRLLLASHFTGNTTTISSQKRLHEYLEGRYGTKIRRVAVRSGGKTAEEELRRRGGAEVSQRTRSFMFLTIAVLAARRTGIRDVVMIAENGQMAIHLPLSRGRIGAFSTHTAHPSFVANVAAFFSSVLGFDIQVRNPYVYKTKAEVVAKVATSHSAAVQMSVSCWKSSRVGSGHCGECVPCLVRRISLEANGAPTSGWERDLLAEDVAALGEADEGKRNLTELAMFARAFATLPESELDMEFCELFSEYFDRDQAAAMYRRFADEAQRVFGNYPYLGYLLPIIQAST